MSGEQIKFRPNISEALREYDQKILAEAQERIKSGEVNGSIDHNIEFFLITTRLKSGEEVTEFIPRNSDDIPLDKEGKEKVYPKEAVEAVQRFFPEMEKPSLAEAVRRLRMFKEKK